MRRLPKVRCVLEEVEKHLFLHLREGRRSHVPFLIFSPLVTQYKHTLGLPDLKPIGYLEEICKRSVLFLELVVNQVSGLTKRDGIASRCSRNQYLNPFSPAKVRALSNSFTCQIAYHAVCSDWLTALVLM
jgi:hypothetical protein